MIFDFEQHPVIPFLNALAEFIFLITWLLAAAGFLVLLLLVAKGKNYKSHVISKLAGFSMSTHAVISLAVLVSLATILPGTPLNDFLAIFAFVSGIIVLPGAAGFIFWWAALVRSRVEKPAIISNVLSAEPRNKNGA